MVTVAKQANPEIISKLYIDALNRLLVHDPAPVPPGVDEFDTVYADSVNGAVAGTGTPTDPTSTLDLAVGIANTNNMRRIMLFGQHTAGVDLSGFEIYGKGDIFELNTIALNGQLCSNTVFRGVSITGTPNVATTRIAVIDGRLEAVTFTSIDEVNVIRSMISGRNFNVITINGSNFTFQDCYPDVVGAIFQYGANLSTLTFEKWQGGLILDGQQNGGTTLDVLHGNIAITDMTGGALNIYGTGGTRVTIAVSCTGGIINIFGDAQIVDNTAGNPSRPTVNNNTILKTITDGQKALREMQWDIARKQLLSTTEAGHSCIREIRTDAEDPPTVEKWEVCETVANAIELRKFDGVTWGDAETLVAVNAEYPALLQVSSDTILVAYYDNADGVNGAIKVIRSTNFGDTWGAAITVLDSAGLGALVGGFTSLTSISLQQSNDGHIHCAFSYEDAGVGLARRYHVHDIFDNNNDGLTWDTLSSYTIYNGGVVGDTIFRVEIFTINVGTNELFLVFDVFDNIVYMRTLSNHPIATLNWGTNIPPAAFTDGIALNVYSTVDTHTEPTGFMTKEGVIYVLFNTNEDGTDDVKAIKSQDTVDDATLVDWMETPIKIFATTMTDEWPSALEDRDGHMIAICTSNIQSATPLIWEITFNAGGFERNLMLSTVPSVPISDNVIVAGITILELLNAQIYLDDVVLKLADPGANTCTISLQKLINNILTTIKTWTITNVAGLHHFSNYFTLMDMFGIPHVADDHIAILASMDAGTIAITGQYKYRQAGL